MCQYSTVLYVKIARYNNTGAKIDREAGKIKDVINSKNARNSRNDSKSRDERNSRHANNTRDANKTVTKGKPAAAGMLAASICNDASNNSDTHSREDVRNTADAPSSSVFIETCEKLVRTAKILKKYKGKSENRPFCPIDVNQSNSYRTFGTPMLLFR
jgi:hypothetical protein